jgi:hypothetical protein
MNKFYVKLVEDAAAPLIAMEIRLLVKLSLFLFAGICGLVAIGFLTFALYDWLEPMIGHLLDQLAIAGIFGILAVAGVILGLNFGKQRAKTLEQVQATTAARAAQLDAMTAPLLSFLQQAGFQRESLMLNAGLALAKQLGPFSLVGIAFLAGLIISKILMKRPEPRASV